ncbi:hypothetical protein JCM33374_g6116 [Metschnikowia sp. JCM 33374]|nr:hypothetical protein JCM33374_g6116 [Metschnikowia sp. JCM 33374]
MSISDMNRKTSDDFVLHDTRTPGHQDTRTRHDTRTPESDQTTNITPTKGAPDNTGRYFGGMKVDSL